MSFYAVAKGFHPGIYYTWENCQKETKGFSGARFKKFKSLHEAEEFVQKFKDPMKTSDYNCPKLNDVDKGGELLQKAKIAWPEDTEEDAELLLALSALEEYPESKKATKEAICNNEKATVSCGTSASCSNVLANFKKQIKEIKKSNPIKIKGQPFMINEDGFVDAYIAGNCENVGKWNCVSGYGIYFAKNNIHNTFKPSNGHISKNIGDMEAAIGAINIAKKLKIQKLGLYCRSAFLLSAATTWMYFWKNNGWRTKNGKAVANHKELVQLDKLLADETIEILWHNVADSWIQLDGMRSAVQLAELGMDDYLDAHPQKDEDYLREQFFN